MNGRLTTLFVAQEMRARGYQVLEGPVREVTGGAADSRKVRPGDLFTAFPGENSDGNLFVADALANGAAAAICTRIPEGDWSDRTLVVAPDATVAVSELAHAWRIACGPRVAGITGTVGKTTAKEMTADVLASKFRTHRSEGNLNSREGLPLALLSLRRDHEIAVLEMGMDSKGEIQRLCEIAEPEVGVVLSVGLTHVEKLGSIEAIQEEKLSLARWLGPNGTAVLNADDPRVGPAAGPLRARVIMFGQSEGATLRRGPVEDRGLEGTAFDVTYEGKTQRVQSPLPGEHVTGAALAAIGTALAMGMTLEEAAAAVAGAHPEGRMHVVHAANGVTILDDRYNSSPASLAGALRMLAGLPGRRMALIGKMAELGSHTEAEHRRAGRIAGESCDVVATFGEMCRPLAEAAREVGSAEVHWSETKEEAAETLARLLRPGDHVLVKGSRSEALETVIPLLESAG